MTGDKERLRFAEGQLSQFFRMKRERPLDHTYWDMHEEDALREEIRKAAESPKVTEEAPTEVSVNAPRFTCEKCGASVAELYRYNHEAHDCEPSKSPVTLSPRAGNIETLKYESGVMPNERQQFTSDIAGDASAQTRSGGTLSALILEIERICLPIVQDEMPREVLEGAVDAIFKLCQQVRKTSESSFRMDVPMVGKGYTRDGKSMVEQVGSNVCEKCGCTRISLPPYCPTGCDGGTLSAQEFAKVRNRPFEEDSMFEFAEALSAHNTAELQAELEAKEGLFQLEAERATELLHEKVALEAELLRLRGELKTMERLYASSIGAPAEGAGPQPQEKP